MYVCVLCVRVYVCLRNENENQATASSQKQINALSGRQVIYLAIVRCFLLSSEFAVAAAASATVAVCVWVLPMHPLPPPLPQPQPEQATQTTQPGNHFECSPASPNTQPTRQRSMEQFSSEPPTRSSSVGSKRRLGDTLHLRAS